MVCFSSWWSSSGMRSSSVCLVVLSLSLRSQLGVVVVRIFGSKKKQKCKHRHKRKVAIFISNDGKSL